VEVTADESPAQVERLLAGERHRRMDALTVTGQARAGVVQRLRHLQRVIACRPVVIPGVDELAVPALGPHARRDQAALLALVSACALLHQHQRLSDQGAVVATPADVALAKRLSACWATADEAGLGPHAARVLRLIRANALRTVTMDQLAGLLPGWTRHALRSGMAELVRLDHLASPRVGRGKRRTYHVVGYDDRSRVNSTYDAGKRKVGGLATPITNFSTNLSDVAGAG
jgi:hypothetical protein